MSAKFSRFSSDFMVNWLQCIENFIQGRNSDKYIRIKVKFDQIGWHRGRRSEIGAHCQKCRFETAENRQ